VNDPSAENTECGIPLCSSHANSKQNGLVVPTAAIKHQHTETSSKWHVEFVIPELRTFSHNVKDFITTGIVTGRARREIIQVLHTHMTAHTIYPTSEQYNTVCKKLISKYPNLKDTEGKTKYVSNNINSY